MFQRLFTAAAITGALATGAMAQQNYNLRFQSSDPSGSAAYKVQEAWAASLAEKSGGTIKAEMVPAGAIVEYNETLEAIGAGILDGHVTDSSYFTGKDPAFALIGNPVGAYSEPEELLAYFNEGGGNEVYNEILAPYNLHFIGAAAQPAEAMASKIPIDGVDDFKGVKMRAPEGMVQSAFAMAGAVPVNLPQSEVFTSLDKGVIDAADVTTLATNDSLGIHDVAKHPIYPGFHSLPLNEVSINKDTWESMTEEQQATMVQSVTDYAANLIETMRSKNEEVAARLEADPEITIHNWSQEERKKFRAFGTEQWIKYAEQSENAQKVYDSLTAYLKSQGRL